ncbi:MAG TPA: S-layer homology domain-containing protein [Sporosarcina psychrophila]|uniref:S-layer homology domain-containing protein n=1 Tax=Sporosarcina psychrophila TaxID=1476 RepID=A0A921G1A5_SPOPS|nr:S-layer homology domain-containing protein [Sporosarcina psychrophila]
MKKILSLFLALILMVSLVPQAKAANADFQDVPKSHPNYADVMFLLDRGVISSGRYFGVHNEVTRDDVAVMVAKAVGLDGKRTKTKFKDIPESWHSSGYINSAVEAGIINGYPDGTFKPGNQVTRGHMAAFIANAFKLTEQADISFKDVPKGSTSYVSVRKLIYSNITSGYPDGIFRPNETLSKAHIAAFLARAIRNQENPSIKQPVVNNPGKQPESKPPTKQPKVEKGVTRGINFKMNVSQVEKAESAKLISKVSDSKAAVLKYETDKYGFYNHLNYYFENGKMAFIVYDFLPDKNSYHTYNEMGYVHDRFHKGIQKELGADYTFVSSKYTALYSTWEKDNYSALLSVNDKNLYTSAQLIFYPK